MKYDDLALISILGFDNNVLTISIFSFSTAIANVVFSVSVVYRSDSDIIWHLPLTSIPFLVKIILVISVSSFSIACNKGAL